MHDKYKKWLSVGGHIELDEEPTQAAVREVKEEVGLDVELYHDNTYSLDGGKDHGQEYRELIPPQFMNIHRVSPTHQHVTMIYFGIAKTDKLILSETEKSDGCKWFTKEELHDPKYGITNAIQKYALAALNKLGK